MCDKCNKPTRIGMQQDPGGKRVRVCKRCGDVLVEKKR
jgi:ribosomal protein L24